MRILKVVFDYLYSWQTCPNWVVHLFQAVANRFAAKSHLDAVYHLVSTSKYRNFNSSVPNAKAFALYVQRVCIVGPPTFLLSIFPCQMGIFELQFFHTSTAAVEKL